MSFTTAHSPGNHVNLSSLCFATIRNWETLQTWTWTKYFRLWLIITAYSFWGCWHVVRGESVSSWQFLPLLVWSLVLMSGHGNLGYGEPRPSAVASNKLCYSLSLWHLYRSFIPHTGPGWRRRWGHCSNGHLFWIICNLTALLSCNAMRPIILFIFYLIHAINIKVFCSQNDVS